VAGELAADVVWFDALCMNVDRTPRNPNLLVWHRRLWLIDHGAALYVHHAWEDPRAEARRTFPAIGDHVLLGCAGPIPDADARLAPRIDRGMLEAAVASVPDDWLGGGDRADYVTFFETRLRAPREFAAEAEEARRGVT
jgi:hypothetical protein